jgi:sialic acid synthase SpsE/sugar phosphate isomerase/epimerase
MQNLKSETLIISEIGINHNGDVNLAKKLIDQSLKAGANAVKFQIRNLAEIYNKKIISDPNNTQSGSQYIFNQLVKSQFTNKKILELFEYSKKKGLYVGATPFDLKSLQFLNNNLNKIDFIKIGSPDFDNVPLIKEAIKKKKYIILSTGMNDEIEIKKIFNLIKFDRNLTAFLHCCSSYPASESEINLKFINKLKKITSCLVGYSGHEKGFLPTLMSIYYDAKIIERHITLDKNMIGPDHTSSLNFDEFKKMTHAIRNIEKMSKKDILNFLSRNFNIDKNSAFVGSGNKTINQNVMLNKSILSKSLVFRKSLKKNTILKENHFELKSPANGLNYLEIDKFLGKKLKKNVSKHDYVLKNSINSQKNNLFKNFSLNKKWGLVTRLGDLEDYIDNKSDLIEIHLTWRELIKGKIIKDFINKDLVVHAPEYFNDKLVDFTTNDKKITSNSLEMLENVINFSKNISNNFNVRDDKGPRVVVHPGGHFDIFKKKINLKEKYLNLSKNLSKLNLNGVRLLIENMPPYPWYFGGKHYNYIFTDPKEINNFCNEKNFKICFDTSHAQLYCNKQNINLVDFIRKIKKHVAYFHFSDAIGVDGEGVQIGKGNIKFNSFLKEISDMDLGFIPEIWQGHLDNGKGFDVALKNLKKIFKKIGTNKKCHH